MARKRKRFWRGYFKVTLFGTQTLNKK